MSHASSPTAHTPTRKVARRADRQSPDRGAILHSHFDEPRASCDVLVTPAPLCSTCLDAPPRSVMNSRRCIRPPNTP